MYTSCKTEDPDITPADFVVEHLLNLGKIIESFESHDKGEKKEFPHQPYRSHIRSFQVVSIFSILPSSDFKKELLINNYLFRYKDPTVTGYYHNIFRPPIS